MSNQQRHSNNRKYCEQPVLMLQQLMRRFATIPLHSQCVYILLHSQPLSLTCGQGNRVGGCEMRDNLIRSAEGHTVAQSQQ